MITELQKRTIKAIVCIFESGHLKGNYAAIARIAGDKGGISYGISQVSLNSGNLGKMLKEYAQRASQANRQLLAPYLDDALRMASKLNTDNSFYNLLKQLGSDPVMQQCQDDYFDANFWQPSIAWGNKNGFGLPLSYGVIYDGFIHGALNKIAEAVIEDKPFHGGDEKEWLKQYVQTRRAWLAEKPKPLSTTVYRMDAFLELIKADNWDLVLPIKIRGVNITEGDLK